MKDQGCRHYGLAERLAAGSWLAAALLYLGVERAAASAFSPAYSYARNYISDLGVPVCGTLFDGRAICSPLHGLMNADFGVQGLLFLGGAVAVAPALSDVKMVTFVAFATLNCVGNCLLGFFPESAPGQFTATLSYHVLGALLAIVFGNATALMSAACLRGLGLPRIHRLASVALPCLAALSLAMLLAARSSEAAIGLADGVWERTSVYTITAWELLSAACLMVRRRGR